MKTILTISLFTYALTALATIDSAAIKTQKLSDIISNNSLTKRQQEISYLLKHDCGSCHGMTLQGGLGPELSPNSLNAINLEQIQATILYGRPGTPMPPWQRFISKNEALWLAEKLKSGEFQ